MAEHVEPRTESPGESQTRWICAQAGLHLGPQVEIRDEFGILVGRVDFMAPESMTVVEFDGLGKYTDAETLRAEKRRQVALERLGYVVVRLVHADLANPARVVRLVREGIERSTARAA